MKCVATGRFRLAWAVCVLLLGCVGEGCVEWLVGWGRVGVFRDDLVLTSHL